MDCRHARAGIIPGIVPRERVNDVRAQRYFAGCTADSFCNSFIQTPGEGNIRWNSQIHNRDTGILAHRHPEPISLLNIFEDIGKLAAGYRCLLYTSDAADE